MANGLEELAELNPKARIADGFDGAYLGWIENRWAKRDRAPIAVYSRRKCIEILMLRDGMSEEDAAEFFDFNVAGAYVGPHTPMFLEEAQEWPTE